MLRLSKLGDYGTLIMAHMARDPRRVFSAAEIAGAVGVGLPTVSKVLKMLARAGLLVSHRGTRGGYVLSRPPENISIVQIIDAVEGTMGMTECSVTAGLCEQEPGCLVRAGWLRVNRLVRAALEGVRLADFAPPAVDPVAVTVEFGAASTGRRTGPAA